jgi:RimJ/RimL family protein N-acetyltransferase
MRFSNVYGFYELNPFPGCNQIVVSNHAFIYKHFRGRGHGSTQHRERLEKARELGYNMIMCTVKDDNESEIHILKKNGWTQESGFVSYETGNSLHIWTKIL